MTQPKTHNSNIERARQTLKDAVATRREDIGATRVASAIQAIAWQNGEVLLDEALGHRYLPATGGTEDTRINFDTPMDIASLTKPLVTATLLMQAVDAGLAAFDDPISRHLPEWAHVTHASEHDAARESATLLHLLNHSSGLPAWD